MQPLEAAGYLAHARTEAFTRRLAEARACVTEALRLCEAPFVAWSAGKDSSALLWLVLEQRPDAEARCCTWWETRLVHSAFDALLAWWRERFPTLRFTEVREGWNPEGDRYGDVDGHLTRVLHAAGGDGCFLGLRKAESNKRSLALARFRDDPRFPIYRYAESGARRVCPLERWTTRDVGALHATHGIPLLAAYDTDLEERTTLRLCEISVGRGAVAKLRGRDRAAYNALVQRQDIHRRDG